MYLINGIYVSYAYAGFAPRNIFRNEGSMAYMALVVLLTSLCLFRPILGSNTVKPVYQHDIIPVVNMEYNVNTNRDKIPTSTYSKFTPTSNNDDRPCSLSVTNASINTFKRAVMSKDLSFVYLRLRGMKLTGSKKIVGEDFWIWTFGGKSGGTEFLTWPIDFGVLSMGILNLYVGGPLEVDLFNTSGDCSTLQVGTNSTDLTIAETLTQLILALIDDIAESNRQYYSSYLCFKKRMWIEPKIVYDMCLNMFCPLEALEYICSYVRLDPKTGRADISQDKFIYRYNTLWWAVPMLVTFLLFIFCPIPILWVSIKCSEYFETVGRETDDYVQNDGSDHITVARTLVSPFLTLYRRQSSCSVRVGRSLVPILSLSFVCLQIYLDYKYFNDIVTICIEKYVPMGFRTMLAGPAKSSDRFLKALGGPFVACSCYIFVAVILLIVPKSVSGHLESGLVNGNALSMSTSISVCTSNVEKYGSTLISNKNGFVKVYSVLIAQFNMFINITFWKSVLYLQFRKCKDVFAQRSRFTYIKVAITIPLRLCEVLLSGTMYGCPVIGLGVIIFRSYLVWFRQNISCPMKRIVIVFFEVILVVSIVFFFYMFCSIFIDACCFISRLCIFTYTGVIVYPLEAYGYFILVISVIYYFSEYLKNFSLQYRRLLSYVIRSCETMGVEGIENEVVTFRSGFKGIKAKLFYDVIELYDPIRKRILVSFLWFCTLTYILGILVHLLMQRKAMRELHTIMHVGTTIFLCAFPKLVKSVFSTKNDLLKEMHAIEEIKLIIRRYLLPHIESNVQEIDLDG